MVDTNCILLQCQLKLKQNGGTLQDADGANGSGTFAPPKQNQQAGEYTLHIPVSDFSTGTYFLTISSDNQTETEKIIINK